MGVAAGPAVPSISIVEAAGPAAVAAAAGEPVGIVGMEPAGRVAVDIVVVVVVAASVQRTVGLP